MYEVKNNKSECEKTNLIDDLNLFQEIKNKFYSKWWQLLKTYYKDISEEFNKDWYIVNITEDIHNICIFLEDEFNTEHICTIPKEYIQNPIQYLNVLNEVRKIQKSIEIIKCEKCIDKVTNTLNNLKEKLQQLQKDIQST